MKRLTDAMAHKLADDPVAELSHMGFNGMGDITDAVSHYRLFNAFIKGCLCFPKQLLVFLGGIAHNKSVGVVTVEPVAASAHIDADDIPFLQPVSIRNTVDHHVVDRNAGRSGEAIQSQEGGFGAAANDVIVHGLVDFFGGNAGADQLLCHIEGIG